MRGASLQGGQEALRTQRRRHEGLALHAANQAGSFGLRGVWAGAWRVQLLWVNCLYFVDFSPEMVNTDEAAVRETQRRNRVGTAGASSCGHLYERGLETTRLSPRGPWVGCQWGVGCLKPQHRRTDGHAWTTRVCVRHLAADVERGSMWETGGARARRGRDLCGFEMKLRGRRDMAYVLPVLGFFSGGPTDGTGRSGF